MSKYEFEDAEELFILRKAMRAEMTDTARATVIAQAFCWSPSRLALFLTYLGHRGIVE
jgi:hypothetical protein